jgi:putative SbcD/Mre11-related phosphoesterase
VTAASYELQSGVCLDARHALWLARERALVLADLHLGYVWAQRHAGLLLPLSAPDDTIGRLENLLKSYRPRAVVLLGDIVHRATRIPEVRRELGCLKTALQEVETVSWVAGNHDRALGALLASSGIDCELQRQIVLGPHLLLHGDAEPGYEEWQAWAAQRGAGGLIIMGHEHPAIRLGDGLVTAKCPCFLAGPRVLILPAFSGWAAGVSIHQGQFMSGLAAAADFDRAVAIVAGKLLPVPVRISRKARASFPPSPSAG